MTNGISSSTKNLTVLDELEAVAQHHDEAIHQFELVSDESTALIRQLADWESEHYFPRHVMVEFPNAKELETWLNKTPISNRGPSTTSEYPEYPRCFVSYHKHASDKDVDTIRRQLNGFYWYPLSHGILPEFHDDQRLVIFDDTAADLTSVNDSLSYLSEPFIPAWVEEELDLLFSDACEEEFEAGMESQFSRGLQQLFTHNPNEVLQSLKARLEDNKANPEVLAEALGWVSRQEALTLRNEIINLLSAGLNNTSPLVRDAAALGLACFDENVAISYLKQAIEKEDVPELREDLEELVQSLEM